VPERIDISKQELEYLIEIEANWGIKESLSDQKMLNNLLDKGFARIKIITIDKKAYERVRLTSMGNQALIENSPWVIRHIEHDEDFCQISSRKTAALIRMHDWLEENEPIGTITAIASEAIKKDSAVEIIGEENGIPVVKRI